MSCAIGLLGRLHKTRAVFDRYHIVSPGDLQEVTRKLAGTFTGTFTPGAVHSPAQVFDLPSPGG